MSTTDIGYAGLAASLLLIAVVVGLSLWQRLRLERSVADAVARALVQLLIVGLALDLVLDEDRSLAWSWLWVLVIVVTAAMTVRHRAREVPGIAWSALVAYLLALGACLAVVFGLDVFPLEARTLVPVSGMIVGNSMRSAVVTARNLADLLSERRADIEARLALGMSGSDALRPSLRSAIRLGLLPQVDATRTVGLVALPGTMTGLILAGVDPEDAVLVQAALLFLILGSAAIAVTVVGLWTARWAVTSDQRFVHVDRPADV